MRPWLSLVVLAILVVFVTSGPARADNREDARKEFTLGQQADKDKDYQTAIEHYLRAYELVPHHFALYNIATAYERLGQLREAAQWFERYLDEAPQSLVKERREVERLILELKLRPAKLTVKTTPVGARVLIDGQPVGVTPYTKAIRGGGHRVRVELEGQREERDVVLEYGEPQSIEVTLNVKARTEPDRAGLGGGNTNTTQPIRPLPHTHTSGMLRVTGGPSGALVAVDDQVVGRVGGEFHVEPGRHNLKVTMYGYQTHDQEFQVTTGQPTEIEVTLQPGTSAPVTNSNRPLFGYFIGATVGADVRGTGAQYMGELGYRIMTVDIGVRVGKASSRTTLDVIFRWAFLKTKLSPFIHAGYSAAAGDDDMGTSSSSLSGYLLGGGIRYDLSRGDTSAVSILAESGVRIIATSSASEDKTVFIPLLASLQLTFGGRTNR
jgi:hypothetical protein